MEKRNKILTLLLAVQTLIIVLVYTTGSDNAPPKVDLLPDVTKDNIDKMVIIDEAGQRVVLEKDEAGWFLAEAKFKEAEAKSDREIKSTKELRYPVDPEKTSTLLAKLAGLQSTRLVTRTKSSHDRLKVGESTFSRKIEISTSYDKTEELYLGAAPNYKTIHVRAGDDTDVYLVKDLAIWEAPAEATTWWPGNYVAFSPEALQKIDLKNNNGSFTLEKDGEAKWRLAGNDDELNEKAVTEFVDRIKDISLVDFVTGDEYIKLGKPAAELVVYTDKNKTDITIWPKDEKSGDHIVKSSNSDLYGRVGAYEVAHLLTRKPADFLTSNE